MKALLTAIIAVAMLGVVGQTSAFEIAIEIIRMDAGAAGGSGENIHREGDYPYDWASGNSDECMQLNINGGPGLTQLYPSASGSRPQHYVINRDPGFHLLAGRCHGGTNFTVLADGAILIGVPQVATTGPSAALIDVWDSPDNDYWVLVKATNLDGAGGGSAGPAGAQGPQGKQGDAGATGAAGPAGAQGPQGDAGADGAAGSAGDTGSAGAQGPQGDAGATGAAGAAGATGATGANAPCKPCADVASAAVDMSCKILDVNPATNIQELRDTAQVVVDTLAISANVCETDCDIGAEINAAIDAKLNP